MSTTILHESVVTTTVSAKERYLFDLQGFLVVPQALPSALLAQLNQHLDQACRDAVAADATTHRFMPVLDWGPALRAVIDCPAIRPYLQEFIGTGYRLDHDYADIIRRGHSPIGAELHGGNTPYDNTCSYQHRDGRIRSGLLAVAFNLHDVAEGDGGFACIPGSHKANEPLPADWISLDHPAACVRPVTGPAGTAILFTEALTHGTLPWRGSRERRTLFFKYSPSGMSWSARYYDADRYPELSPAERAILEAPNARYHGREPARQT